MICLFFDKTDETKYNQCTQFCYNNHRDYKKNWKHWLKNNKTSICVIENENKENFVRNWSVIILKWSIFSSRTFNSEKWNEQRSKNNLHCFHKCNMKKTLRKKCLHFQEFLTQRALRHWKCFFYLKRKEKIWTEKISLLFTVLILKHYLFLNLSFCKAIKSRKQKLFRIYWF